MKEENIVVARVIRGIIQKMLSMSSDCTLNIDRVCDAIPNDLFDSWTDEENFEFRKRVTVRVYMNLENLFSIGKGEYYDWEHGEDQEKLDIIKARSRAAIVGRGVARNNRLSRKNMPGQVTIVFDEDENFIGLEEVNE